MSEVTTYKNIISVEKVTPVQQVQSLLNTLKMFNKVEPHDLDLNEFMSILSSDLLNELNVQIKKTNVCNNHKYTLQSPNLLRGSFQRSFAANLKNFESRGLSLVVAKKTSFLAALKKMDFKVSRPDVIKTNILSVINSKDIKTLNREIILTTQKLEVEHTKVFATNLAKVCANASYKVGFKDVEVRRFNGKLEVIATNSRGQHLNSEISVNPQTKAISATSETIGIFDNSCRKIMSSFNDELKKMGIKIGQEKSWFTAGIPQMPYSKWIELEDKDRNRKEKEHQRLVKLNNNRNQKLRN